MRTRGTDQATAKAEQPRGLRKWWFDRPLRAKGLVVIALPVIALMAITSANLLLLNQENQERTVSTNARTLASAAALVLADAVNAETGLRGYAATRDPLFLTPYTLTLSRIGAERRSLQTAAAVDGYRRQQQMVNATTGRVLAQLAQLRVAARNGIPVGRLRSALEQQKNTMDRLRSQVARLAAAPTALVLIQHSKITTLQTRIQWLDITALVAGVLAGVAGIALFTSGIASRLRRGAENARRLGVGQPLAPIIDADDEIGRLAKNSCWSAGLRSW
jgi:CHASE3 domain sensor protein